MKKVSLIFLLAISIYSCKQMNSETDESQNADTTKAKDTTLVGADKDENGCLSSAGYTWSKVNKECVKIFTGVQLNPAKNQENEDMVLCAYVLFNEAKDKAEVFLPNEESIVLSKQGDATIWADKDYQLVDKKGFTLKKGTETIFLGDAEIGNKVTGSDKVEE